MAPGTLVQVMLKSSDAWNCAPFAGEVKLGVPGAGPSPVTVRLRPCDQAESIEPTAPPTEDDIKTHGPKFDCQSYVRVGKGGKFELEGDKAKPFVCFPGENRDWSTPEDMNFK